MEGGRWGHTPPGCCSPWLSHPVWWGGVGYCRGGALVGGACCTTQSGTLLCRLLWTALPHHVSSLSLPVFSVSQLGRSLFLDRYPGTGGLVARKQVTQNLLRVNQVNSVMDSTEGTLSF